VALATDRGDKVVKLYRPQWKPAAVRYGHSIMLRLEELGFPAVRLFRTPAGATWIDLEGQLFSVFDFVAGTNFSLNFLRRGDRLRLTAMAAGTLARLHRCLDGFVPEGEHHLAFASRTGGRTRDLAWHVAKLEELRRRSADLTDEEAVEKARRLTELSGRLVDEMAGLETALADAPLPRTVIHGDFGMHNLIFPPLGDPVPLDFEVARLDWRVNDLISALGKYRYGGGTYDLESMETFIRAYADVLPFTADELRLLPPAWRLYRLRAAVQYWNSYFETDGPVRKLGSALHAIGQSRWVVDHPEAIRRLCRAAAGTS
jgi:Ser/Thr protein kinase RdoA (MazF antagonist)